MATPRKCITQIDTNNGPNWCLSNKASNKQLFFLKQTTDLEQTDCVELNTEELLKYFRKKCRFEVYRGDIMVRANIVKKCHYSGGWSRLSRSCVSCANKFTCEYVNCENDSGSALVVLEQSLKESIEQWDLNTPLAPFKKMVDKRLYVQLFEHQEHLRYVRYRIGHYWCSKDIDYTGMDLIPVVDRDDFRIYTSQSGYKIFLKDFDDSTWGDIDKWILAHPVVIDHVLEYPELTGEQCDPSFIREIRKDYRILSERATLQKLLYLLHQGHDVVGYIRVSMYMIYGVRDQCRGIIIEGPPGLGKTYDILNTLEDSYWMPYDHKTKVYYDGYMGQENIVIDDLGHHHADEWKILIRLINGAPWKFPMAESSLKDLISNVSRNVVVTTNCMTKLMSLPLETRNAICRRFECYRYLADGTINYMRYNMNTGKYELVYNLSRESFRQGLGYRALPQNFEIRKFKSNLMNYLMDMTSETLGLFGLPRMKRLCNFIADNTNISFKCDSGKRSRMDAFEIPVILARDLFDWSVVDGKKKMRSLIYYTLLTGDKVAKKILKSEKAQQIAYVEAKICGLDIPIEDNRNLYDQVEQFTKTVVHPAYVVKGVDFSHVPEEVLEAYGPDADWMRGKRPDKYVPERTEEIPMAKYELKDEYKQDRVIGKLFKNDFTIVDLPQNSSYVPFREEYLNIVDESEYRPTTRYTVSFNYKKINEVVHQSCSSKTRKRREQRKKNKNLDSNESIAKEGFGPLLLRSQDG